MPAGRGARGIGDRLLPADEVGMRGEGGRPHLAREGRVLTEGLDQDVEVARDGDAGAVAGGVRATEGRMLPDEACAGEFKREEGGACLSEGEEGGADIVEAAGERELSGLRGAA